MKGFLRPKVLLPIVLSVALLASLFTFADARTVLGQMESFQHLYLLFYLLAMILYEIIRAVQWRVLLRAMDIPASLRAEIFSFAVGEIAKSLPVGNYLQNYILRQSEGTDFGRTSAATTLIILTEVASCLLVVVGLGLGSWTSWLRPLICIGLVVTALLVVIGRRLLQHAATPRWVKEHQLTTMALAEWREFRDGVRDLLRPGLLLKQGLLGAGYVITAGFALYMVIRGMGMHNVSLPEALAVYCFSLGFSLIFPLPVDVGVMELSGVGAFLAINVDRDSAVSAVLINRVLGLGSALVIAAVVVLVLHREIPAALGIRRPAAPDTALREDSRQETESA